MTQIVVNLKIIFNFFHSYRSVLKKKSTCKYNQSKKWPIIDLEHVQTRFHNFFAQKYQAHIIMKNDSVLDVTY